MQVTFLVNHMAHVDNAVAAVPTRKSKGRAAPEVRLNSRQPKLRPGMAAGVKKARTQRASESRNWMAQVAEPGRRKDAERP